MMQTPARIPITVVMRSYNDAAILPRTLAALDAQRGVDIRLHVYESASADRSREILEEYGCDRLEFLEPGTYQSSRVLNAGVRHANTELVAFINSDAVMLEPDVLLKLAKAIQSDNACAGAYARQAPRKDANAMTRLDYHIAFENRHLLGERAASWMTLVCSAIRKSAWETVPFDESLTFAEDAAWSEAVARHGWHCAYVPDAKVEHSHNYTWKERYRRSFGDASALASLATTPPPGNAVSGFLWPYFKRCVRDALRLARLSWWTSLPRIPAHRWPQMLGEWRGALAGWKHFNGSVQPGSTSKNSTPGLQPLATAKDSE